MTAYEHQAVDHNASIRAERPDPDQVQVTITQDAAQAPQDGANGGDVGSGKGEGVSKPQTGAQAPGEGDS